MDRRRAEQASFNAEEDYLNLDSGSHKLPPFPAFVYKHFKNRRGIKHMVRSVCLDLVCNVQLYRKQRPDVEVFARFVEEFYGQKELCFFLDLRAEAHRVTRLEARRKAVGTQALWMTLPDCVRVARGVFVDPTTLYFRDLIATVTDQMATDSAAAEGVWNPTRGRISLSAFLYLAMVCFVSPKEPIEIPQQHQQQALRPQKGSTPAVGHGGCRLYIRDRSGGTSGNNQCASTTATGCDGSVAALSPPLTPTPRGRNTFRGSPGAAGFREDGTPSPASQVLAPRTNRILTTPDAVSEELHRGVLSLPQLSPCQRHDDNGGARPSTPTILEWGLNNLLSYVRGGENSAGEERGIRTGGSNAQDAWSAFSPASSGLAGREEALPPPPPPPAWTPSKSASGVPREAKGEQGVAHPRIESQTAVPAGDSGGSVISGPAKQATGGGRASSSAATVEGRARGDTSANLAPANDRRDVSASQVGCTEGDGGGGGDSHDRVVLTGQGGSKGEGTDVQPQLRQQDSGAASPRRTTQMPPSPASIMSDSPRHRGGPLRALSPLALLGRIERSPSPSPSPRSSSPTPGDAQTAKHQSINIRPAGQVGRRETQETGLNREVATGDVFVGTSRSMSALPPGGGSIDNMKGDDKGGALTEHFQGDDKHLQDGPEFSHDVALAATAWLASFERRFMPCLVAEAEALAKRAGVEGARKEAATSTGSSRRAQGSEAKDGMLPPAISRVLHEEVFRVLTLRCRDLDIVARVSPELLKPAVVKSFWMFEDAVSTRASHARSLSNMGRLLEDRGHPDEALLCFKEASSADTGSAEALCCRASNLQRRGDFDGAAFYFEGALARDHSLGSAWYGLGLVKGAQGKHADAVEALSRWLEGLEHKDGEEKSGSGVSAAGRQARGCPGGGRGGGEAGAAMAKGLVQLGNAYRKLGQDKQAQKAYERAVSVDDCPEAHFQLGSLFQARGNHDAEAALQAFARAVKAAGAAASAAGPGASLGPAEASPSFLP
eukprot:g5593.t1